MIGVEIRVTRMPRIGAIGFAQVQMQNIAQAVADAERERVAQGLDRFDQKMRPLAPDYAERKRRKGRQPIRDMRLTGNMLGSLQVTDASATGATVDFRGNTPLRKAYFRQRQDQFHGISASGFTRVNALIERLHTENVRGLLG